ncbi:MAG: hypothetical protein H7A24_16520 [Leptospiraceae bacterium]|nr:hypothetical protein [Leptospiraceae bacterium]MCP5513494.1 hypothetical protein [Leptospiraceae bacterium]
MTDKILGLFICAWISLIITLIFSYDTFKEYYTAFMNFTALFASLLGIWQFLRSND